jgi:hypothetical protein
MHRRETLEKKWNEAAKKTGAASLRFVNDVDGESVPPFMDNFVYIEQEYI